jgi:hypothetical protein
MPADVGYTTDVREVKDVVASTRANTFIGKKKKKKRVGASQPVDSIFKDK